MSDKDLTPYQPFLPVPECYRGVHRPMTRERILQAFSSVLGLPTATISTKFRELINAVVEEEYPDFCCSTARAIVEGRLTGVPLPMVSIPYNLRKRLDQALFLLDLFETVLFRWMEEEVSKKSVEVRTQAYRLRDQLGGLKAPIMIEFIEFLEKRREDSHAKQNEKAGSSHAGGGSRLQDPKGHGNKQGTGGGVREGRSSPVPVGQGPKG